MKFVTVIGLEVHIQLKTRTKMFCRCASEVFGEEPNSRTCPVCLGLPGALPVTNAEAVRLALLAGETFGASHPKVTWFDRKNYFYPDLPKGYQISQFTEPINVGGQVSVEGKKIRLRRAHLEEDAGKLLHRASHTVVDFNRSGLPLLEVVTEPEIASPWEARLVGQKIQLLARYAGFSDADMEKGSLRMDANISLRPEASKKLGVKVEVKNINSFRSVERALEFEIERQTKLLESGKKIIQETRGWDETKGETVTQRVKEEADDYRYFPEPDLPAIKVTEKVIAQVRKVLPELPEVKIERFKKAYGLNSGEAEVLASDVELADFYEEATRAYQQASGEKLSQEMYKRVATWITVEYLARLKSRSLDLAAAPVTPAQLAELVYLFDRGKVSASSAKTVLTEMFERGESPSKIIARVGLVLQSDAIKLADLARVVVHKNGKAVQDFKAGKTQALQYLLGQLQKEARGQADPTTARQVLERVLGES